MQKSNVLFLGCGSSAGVPILGCSCSTCTSTDLRNRRLRSSLFVRTPNNTILIDAGPDFREQGIRSHLHGVPDALFITHTHYDHVAGMEELRVYNFMSGKPVPCYLSEQSMQAIKKMFYFHFLSEEEGRNYTAQFDYKVLKESAGTISLNGEEIQFVTYFQGGMPVLGFRFGNLAYMTDIKEYSPSVIEFLEGIETLIVSAIRHGHSKVQFNVDEAVDFSRRAHVKHTLLMHMSHELEYWHLKSLLPEGIEPAYDGMEVQFDM